MTLQYIVMYDVVSYHIYAIICSLLLRFPLLCYVMMSGEHDVELRCFVLRRVVYFRNLSSCVDFTTLRFIMFSCIGDKCVALRCVDTVEIPTYFSLHKS